MSDKRKAQRSREIQPGERFGLLTVLSRNENGTYRCACDCGGVREAVWASHLLGGHTKSCGCARSGQAESRALVGQRFGKLTVVERTAYKDGGSYLYLCRCDCGGKRYATSNRLRSGWIKSCGCLKDGRIDRLRAGAEVEQVDHTNLSMLAQTTPRSNSASGVRGVSWNKKVGKWWARIMIQGASIDLGFYSSLDEAASARRDAEKFYFDPVLARNGREPPDRDKKEEEPE